MTDWKKGDPVTYCPELKALFIHTYKTGGTSIRVALQPWKVQGIRFAEHPQARVVRDVMRDWDNLFTFACVRNPWDWVYSHYCWILQQQEHKGEPHEYYEAVRSYGGFNAYVARCILRAELPFVEDRQRHWTDDWNGDQLVKFVMRFETLQRDWEHVCQRLGIKAELPHLFKTHRKVDYREAYSMEAREIVAWRYGPDIERFGYSF